MKFAILKLNNGDVVSVNLDNVNTIVSITGGPSISITFNNGQEIIHSFKSISQMDSWYNEYRIGLD